MNLFIKLNKILFLIILLWTISIIDQSYTQNKNWFVDKNASGNNSGVNWENAWTSFSNITWNLLSNGDTILISGGNNETTYFETLTIGKGNIVIRRSNDIGHNGKVIIDGQGVRSNGISNQNSARINVLIDGVDKDKFIIRGFNYRGIEIRHANNQTIRNLTVVIDKPEAFSAFFLYGNEWQLPPTFLRNILVENVNVLQDSGYYPGAGNSDGFQIGGVDGITIRNCYVKLQNSDNIPHQDCIQFYHSKNITIEKNQFYSLNAGATLNKQGIYMTNCGGDIKIRNNYIYLGQDSFGSGIALELYDLNWFTNYTQLDSLIISNNTVESRVTSKTNAIRISQSFGDNISGFALVKNNIFKNGAFWFEKRLFSSFSDCDFNVYYRNSGSISIWDGIDHSNGASRSWTTWQGFGYDLNSFTTDPQLDGYTLNINSIAIDNGTNLSGLGYLDDIDRKIRPQGPTWDIGAYEYFNGTVLDIIPPELIGAELIDSTTIILEFSEAMNESSVEDINNYAVNNGINILSATMNGNQVNLSTTEHSPGIYEVVVGNVTDLAGNVINNSYNSFIYEYFNQNLNLTQLPVVQADADHWYLNYTPDRTIDGIAGGESRWGGAVPMPDTIEYRLNDLQVLNQTKLSFYAWESGRIYNYTIQVSIDSITWNEIKSNIPSHSGQWSVEDFDPVEAKYIRVILLSNNQSVWAGLWEAEFWGHLKIPTNNDDEKNIPSEFMLEQNYPNPFNPETKIRFYLPTGSDIKLSVYNILGEEVKTITEGFYSEGFHEFVFNASDIVSGVYVYRLESEKFVANKKMVYIK